MGKPTQAERLNLDQINEHLTTELERLAQDGRFDLPEGHYEVQAFNLERDTGVTEVRVSVTVLGTARKAPDDNPNDGIGLSVALSDALSKLDLTQE